MMTQFQKAFKSEIEVAHTKERLYVCYCSLATITDLCLFLAAPLIGLWSVIMAFAGHTHLYVNGWMGVYGGLENEFILIVPSPNKRQKTNINNTIYLT